MRRTLLVLAACTLALAGCGGGDDSGSTAQPQGGPHSVTLQAGVPAVIASEQLHLTLAAVDDSRCPAQVQCAWAGEAVARIDIQQAGEAAARLVLSTQPAQSTGSYRGWRVTLTAVEPAPVQAQPIPLAQYRVIVRIDKG